MTHWGWYWKIKKDYIPRSLCSNVASIDSFRLIKKETISGFLLEQVGIKGNFANESLVVTRGKNRTNSYVISIDKQACNYGGFRYFFKCPLCSKRMRFLYLAQNSLFLCRKCLNLGYKSQRLRPSKRYAYMSQKIQNHIRIKGGTKYHQRPPRMHNATYEALKDRIMNYDIKEQQATYEELNEWY